MVDFGKIGAFPRIGAKYTDYFSDYHKTCNKRQVSISNKRRHLMDAGCSETCSNRPKCRVSNKRRSDRSALDAGGGSVNNILTTSHAR